MHFNAVLCKAKIKGGRLLSTHDDRQGVDILLLFVCTVMDFSGKDTASGVNFCTVFHRRPKKGISHVCKLCYPEAKNHTNRPPTGM